MAFDASERELIADLIGSVRTVAGQLVALHLQLGAMRALLARKNMISEAEFRATFTELDAVSSTEAVLTRDFPDVTEDVFEELLRRLRRPDLSP